MTTLNSIFNLNPSTAAELETDRSNTGYKVLPTDIYDAVVKYAYLDAPAKGTPSIQVVLEVNGKTIQQAHYFYKDTRTPTKVVNGKPVTSPGMKAFNSLAYIVKGVMGTELPMEQKIIKKFDRATRTEIPVKVDCFVDLINANIKVGIKELLKHKNQKMPDGSYMPTTQITPINEVDKYYSVDGKTSQELAGNSPAEYGPKWLTAYKDKPFEEKLKVEPIDVSAQATPFDEPVAPAATTLFDD